MLFRSKAQSATEDAKNAIDFKMVPSKAETGGAQPALPQAFKEAPVPAVEAKAAPEPTKRAKKAEAAPAAPAKDVSSILDQWATDDDE